MLAQPRFSKDRGDVVLKPTWRMAGLGEDTEAQISRGQAACDPGPLALAPIPPPLQNLGYLF